MSVCIVWLPEALEDVERRYDFLWEKGPVAAGRATKSILDGARLLEEVPEAGRPLNDGNGRRELFSLPLVPEHMCCAIASLQPGSS